MTEKRRMTQLANGILQTLRISTGVIVFLGVAALGMISATAPLAVLQLGLAVALIAMASFAINDFYDVDKDRINSPRRAIPSGKLRSVEALLVGVVVLAVGVVIGLMTLKGLSAAVFVMGAIGGATYSEIARRFPAAKGPLTAALCVLVLLLDITAFRLPFAYLWSCVACFSFIFGRELLMDVRDLQGDIEVGLATLAARLGKRTGTQMGLSLLVFSIVPLAIFLIASGAGAAAWSAWILYSLVTAFISLHWRSCVRTRQDLAISASRISLLAGIATIFL